ncbi:MAG: hypothetical protein ACRENP_12140 [Longimicrobiales bacterium]
MTRFEARAGIVLPVVIGVLVLIELLAVAIISAAHQERAVSDQRVWAVHAQLAGRSALAKITAARHDSVQALAPGDRMSVVDETDSLGTRVIADLERLAPGLFLARASTESGPVQRAARANAALLLVSFDPQLALAQLPAAINLGGNVLLEGTSQVDGSNAALAPNGWSAARCSTWLALPDALGGLAVIPGAQVEVSEGARLSGAPPIHEHTALSGSSAFDQLGGWSLAQLAERADRHESGLLELSPAASATACRTDAPGNWGAPLESDHPCADYLPLIHAAGSLVLSAGAGQGLLVVEGDLTLAAGARFYGVALVRGSARLESGAVLEGALLARSQAGPTVLASGRVRGSTCAVLRALTRPPALNRLERRAPRSWIPVF